MKKVIEPPVLMSRMLTFVLSTSIVVLLVLVFTLIKMIPLERPEVFFLYTPTRNTTIMIEPMNTDDANQETLKKYLEGFIREYIISRYTLYPGIRASVTRNNWSKIVKPWSDDKVFSDFANSRLYKRYMFSQTLPTFSCHVDFSNTTKELAVVKMRNGAFQVMFSWFCENSNGQTAQQNYKIQLRLQSELEIKMSGALDDLKKLHDNPLGIRVVEYNILDNKKDPLSSELEFL